MNRTPSVNSLSEAKLVRALVDTCRWDALSWGDEAAVRLLIAQGTWLRRNEFRRHITVEVRALTAGSSSSAEPSSPDEQSPEPPASPTLLAKSRSERELRLAAWVDWRGVAAEPDGSSASSSERALLRLACHLAGSLPPQAEGRVDAEWTLAEILQPLDTTHALIASRAVAMAAIGPDAVGPLQ